MSEKKKILEVVNLTMHFGVITAAERENVTIYEREFVGIVGPNGAGKTTFLNLVTGYLKPQEGEVRFLGKDIVGTAPFDIVKLGVGRSFQIPQLFDSMTVFENMLVALATASSARHNFWQTIHQLEREARAHDILRQFGLDDQVERRANELPEGGRKLLDIAMAFALEPQLLLMDEPTSGVSVDEKFEVMDTLSNVLRANNVTALFVEHDMDVVRRYADRVMVLSSGEFVADGPPDEVLENEEIRRTVAGWEG